jgi:hypothetical protein
MVIAEYVYASIPILAQKNVNLDVAFGLIRGWGPRRRLYLCHSLQGRRRLRVCAGDSRCRDRQVPGVGGREWRDASRRKPGWRQSVERAVPSAVVLNVPTVTVVVLTAEYAKVSNNSAVLLRRPWSRRECRFCRIRRASRSNHSREAGSSSSRPTPRSASHPCCNARWRSSA